MLMAYVTQGPTRRARKRGMGDDDGSDLFFSITSAVDPSTGIPIVLELGFGLLGAFFLMSWTGGVNKTYKRSRKKKLTTKARKASLKAQLAGL